MPAVVGVIGAVIGGVASAVGAVVATIASIIAPIVGVVSAIITPILGGITSVLGSVAGTVLAPIASVVNAIGSAISGPINTLGSSILGPVSTIRNGLLGGIANITSTITTATMPVLGPIRDTLTTIRAFVGGASDIITEGLGPIKDVAEMVRSVSTIKMAKQLLTGTQSLSDVIGDVADEAGIKTAGAIAGLWRDTVDTTTGVLTVMEDNYKLIANEVDTAVEGLKEGQISALTDMTETLDTSLAAIEAEFSGETRRLHREVRTVERRVEDVPEFQKMLIKALA